MNTGRRKPRVGRAQRAPRLRGADQTGVEDLRVHVADRQVIAIVESIRVSHQSRVESRAGHVGRDGKRVEFLSAEVLLHVHEATAGHGAILIGSIT